MWYSVEALFKCGVTKEDTGEILYEKSIFLIEVENEQQVQEKAKQMALSFETNYKNHEGNDVRWKFVKILDTEDICERELYDGVEVFSRLEWDRDVSPLHSDDSK